MSERGRRRGPGRALGALAGLVLCLGAAAAPAAARVVLLGIDGASWSVLDPLLAAGELPELAALLERGAAAELETVEPVISPVVWTSLATGRSPRAHRVSGFAATRLDLATPTVFERLAAAGLRVGLYEYLVTWPPPALPGGFVVPDWMRRDGRVWPPDLWERAGVEPYVVEYDGVYSRDAHAAGVVEELARKPGTWLALARAFDLDVGAVTIYAVDRACHRFWRDAYPDGGGGPGGALPREGSLLGRALRDLDQAVGAVARSLGPEDTLLVASDHGFQAREERHVWVGRTRAHLGRAGLDEQRDAFSLIREWGVIAARVHPGPFDAREAVLERLAGFFESARGPGGEALLDVQVLDAAPRPPGHERPLGERLWQAGFRLVARMLYGARFEDPAHGWVVARFEVDALERLWPDALVSLAGETLRADRLVYRETFDGGHHPTAVFLAAGGPIRRRAGRGRLSVLDVAPLLVYLAGQPIPDDLEGELPRDWIDPAHLAAHPPEAIAASAAPRLAPSEVAPAPEIGDAEMLERLRSLGYLE
jgi:arylsulfatase A-like enzyme